MDCTTVRIAVVPVPWLAWASSVMQRSNQKGFKGQLESSTAFVAVLAKILPRAVGYTMRLCGEASDAPIVDRACGRFRCLQALPGVFDRTRKEENAMSSFDVVTCIPSLGRVVQSPNSLPDQTRLPSGNASVDTTFPSPHEERNDRKLGLHVELG